MCLVPLIIVLDLEEQCNLGEGLDGPDQLFGEWMKTEWRLRVLVNVGIDTQDARQQHHSDRCNLVFTCVRSEVRPLHPNGRRHSQLSAVENATLPTCEEMQGGFHKFTRVSKLSILRILACGPQAAIVRGLYPQPWVPRLKYLGWGWQPTAGKPSDKHTGCVTHMKPNSRNYGFEIRHHKSETRNMIPWSRFSWFDNRHPKPATWILDSETNNPTSEIKSDTRTRSHISLVQCAIRKVIDDDDLEYDIRMFISNNLDNKKKANSRGRAHSQHNPQHDLLENTKGAGMSVKGCKLRVRV